MPKIKWIKPVKPPDYLKEMFKRYQKACGFTSADIGKEMGKSAEAVRGQLYRGCDTWSVADVRQWCKVLGVTSAEEIGRAILNGQ